MEAQAALVGTDSAVELDTVAGVDLGLTLIVDPCHTELEAAVGGDQTLQQSSLAVTVLVAVDDHAQGLQNLFNGLNELGLVCVLCLYPGQGFVYITHKQMSS